MPTDIPLGLLDRTLNRIAQHPDEWQQSSWWCGTAGCFAAHGLIEAGYSIDELDLLAKRSWQRRVRDTNEVFISPIAIRAQEVMGLDEQEAAVLFDGDNNFEMLERMVYDIKGRNLQDWEHYAELANLYGDNTEDWTI